jgi:hypothetical protein
MLLVFTGIFTFLVSPSITVKIVPQLTVSTYKVDAYPDYAASALAANAFVRCSFAGMLHTHYSLKDGPFANGGVL